MRCHRGYRWTCGRVELGRGVDVEWHLEAALLPRVRLWPDERGMLVGMSLGDRNGDPLLGVDVRLTGRFGRWWADRVWERRRRRGR